jgi:hypothetical protein
MDEQVREAAAAMARHVMALAEGHAGLGLLMARRKAFNWLTRDLGRHTRDLKRQSRNAEAYNCVQKIIQDGCPKKISAVSEAARALKRSESSIWTSLREHERDRERELRWQAKTAREERIALGEEEPTDEEMEEAADQWFSFLIDLSRGK